MKSLWRRTSAFLMALVIVLSAAGCGQTPSTGTPNTTDPTQGPDLAAIYYSAVEAVSESDLCLEITYSKKTTVASQSYKESGFITLDYWNPNTDNFLAKVQQDISFGGSYAISLTEIYSQGNVYQTIEADHFTAALSQEAFMARYTPLQMLDITLYNISADSTNTLLRFTDATAGESWAMPAGAMLKQASGTAELDETGKLKKTGYTLEYLYGPATVALDYAVTVKEAGTQPTVPTDLTEFVSVDYIDAAYVLDHAYGYLSQAKHATTEQRILTLSAAGGIGIQESYIVDTYAVGSEYAARVETNYGFTDYNTGETTEEKLVEKFINGKYTSFYNDGPEETDSSIRKHDIEKYLTDELTYWILPNEYIASAKITDLGSVLLVEYTATEQFGLDFCGDLNERFYGDRKFLDQYASSYKTTKNEFYLSLDKFSLLPTAVGVNYEGVHVIDGYEYVLSQNANQSFDLASISSYETIYEKPAPDAEPEVPATPLFYRVTGPNGQEMWLLGTIHIGDNRTAYLPEEIYAALQASDALALEFNTEAFEEQMQTDEALIAEVYPCYFYTDGSTISDHLDTPELYETAVQLLKAYGYYRADADWEKPHSWSNYIDAFHLRQFYALCSEKGVDNRLQDLAKEYNIPIREVESGLFQLKMLANYSDDLQEFMLYSAVVTDALYSWEETSQMYELWCAGDEAALTQLITGEGSWEIAREDIVLDGLTGEDLEKAQAILADLDNINARLREIQQEYNKAMSTDRNKGMLEVAKQYLESGDTVFYAVGLAHLLAEDGLVNTLRDAGYTVELVTYK